MSLFQHFYNLRNAFRQAFNEGRWKDDDGTLTVHAKAVLMDLRQFCRASETCVVVAKDGHIDTHATILAEGRREVLLRIQHYLNLDDDALMKLKGEDE